MSAAEAVELIGLAMVGAGLVCLSRPRWRAMEQAQQVWRVAAIGFALAVVARCVEVLA